MFIYTYIYVSYLYIYIFIYTYTIYTYICIYTCLLDFMVCSQVLYFHRCCICICILFMKSGITWRHAKHKMHHLRNSIRRCTSCQFGTRIKRQIPLDDNFR